jgi:hypothetical protein
MVVLVLLLRSLLHDEDLAITQFFATYQNHASKRLATL